MLYTSGLALSKQHQLSFVNDYYITSVSCYQYRSPWPSLAIRLYCPLLPGGLPGYILYRHRAQVQTGHPTFVHPCEGVHKSMSFMSSSLLLQQCSASLVNLIWIVFMMGGQWLYSCCFVECCLQDLFNIACSILE